MSKPIHFEYQTIKGITLVALDARMADFDFQPVKENGKLVMRRPDVTIKDCRKIDGCVYFHLGRTEDSVMVDLIEKFQKLKKEGGWKQEQGLVVPDHKFTFD